ncbi:hypothetical protein [Photobacterium rosenbergii]|uniref:Porin n=1 Tax=Photobacterium rosenbergii TaxID=294936 RepID=A0ABU3ZHM7_9GAMM|nr:hypothetical protein [Photobacterium rosenbergii]MDV5169646.1 hypothetical protein [Photobacterium rosenbergii]
MKKLVLLTPLALALSTPTFADEVIDPADVTNVYTQTALMVSGDSSLLWQGQVAGGMENGQQFALLAEATFDNEDNDSNKFGLDYQNSRVQYFHVFDTGINSTPKAGVSFDYINTRTNAVKNDLLAVGGVAAVNPASVGGLLVFPMANVIAGNMELADGTKDDLTGFGASLITAKYIGDTGAYVVVTPEIQNLSGDTLDVQNITVKTGLNAPLNSNRSTWINTRFDFAKSTISVNGTDLDADWETKAWLGVRHDF